MKHRSVAMLAVTGLLLAGCSVGGSGSGGQSDEPIKIGASLPLTGNLAAFGELIENGYQAAVNDVNADGGIEVDGVTRPVRARDPGLRRATATRLLSNHVNSCSTRG